MPKKKVVPKKRVVPKDVGETNQTLMTISGFLTKLEEDNNLTPSQLQDSMAEADLLDRPGMLERVALLYANGIGYPKMAEQLGVAPSAVRNLVKRDSFKAIIDDISNQAIETCKDYLRIGAVKATTTMLNLLDDMSSKVRFSAAKDIMNRAGLKEIAKAKVRKEIDDLGDMSDEKILEYLLFQRQKKTAIPAYAYADTSKEVDTDGQVRSEVDINTEDSI